MFMWIPGSKQITYILHITAEVEKVVKTQLNSAQLNSSWFDHIIGIVTHHPPTHGKLLDQFQTTQEADFRHATLF